MPGKKSRSSSLREAKRRPSPAHRRRLRPSANRKKARLPTVEAATPRSRPARRSLPRPLLPRLPRNPLRSRLRSRLRRLLQILLWKPRQIPPWSPLQIPLRNPPQSLLPKRRLMCRTRSSIPTRRPRAPHLCEALLRCSPTIPRCSRATLHPTRSLHGLARASSMCSPARRRIPASRIACRLPTTSIRRKRFRPAGSMRTMRAR